jgi:hypothetical protein
LPDAAVSRRSIWDIRMTPDNQNPPERKPAPGRPADADDGQRAPPPTGPARQAEPDEPRMADDGGTQTLPLEALGLTPPSGHPAPPLAPEEPTAEIPRPPEATARMPAADVQSTARSQGAWDQITDTTPDDVGLAVDPEPDDEPELPYSLQPESIGESTPMASRASRVRRTISAKAWLLTGMLAGLVVSAWIYFRPWKLNLPLSRPVRTELSSLPAVDGIEPPAQWTRVGGLFFGKDEINKPWIYDPTASAARVAPQSVPPDLDWKLLSLVAQPPLEPFTRLAWIQPSGGAALLVCHDFSFQAASEPAQAMDTLAAILSWSVALPGGSYAMPPTVADVPDPGVGLLLVTVSAAGELSAWNPHRSSADGPVWKAELGAPPMASPRAWMDLRSRQGRLWLMTPTTTHLAVLDAADGREIGRLEWPRPMDVSMPMATAPFRLGDRGWGWLGSDGRQAILWSLSTTGLPALERAMTLPEGLGRRGQAPRLCTFPDPDAPGEDQFALTVGSGTTVWWSRARMKASGKEEEAGETPTIEARATGELAAVDLNGDGYWDLAGINADGNMWYCPGPSHRPHPGEQIPWGDQVSAALGSAVYWRLDTAGLVGEYFDRGGRPQEARLPLPTLTDAHIGPLLADWEERHPGS